MGRRRFGSVRARASLGATAVVAVALLAAGLAVLLSLRSNLTEQADRQADRAAREVALDIASQAPDRVAYADLELPDEEDHPVQVTDEDGRLLVASEGLERISGTGVRAVRAAATPGPGASSTGSGSADGDDDSGDADGDDSNDSDDSHDRGGSDDDPAVGEIGDTTSYGSGSATVDGDTADYRFATIEATDRAGETVLVHAGASLADRQDAVRTTGLSMLAGLPVLLLVVGGVTWLMTRRALRPVEGIRRELAAITASEDLSRRVPEPATHDEVARLARTTNETLTALEASVERQRRFVADASHELRSPIASLRTQLEVGEAHPALLDVPGAVADTVRLQRLAADLLLLARLDAGERPARAARFDLGALVHEEVSQRTLDRIPVAVDVLPGAEVAGSRGQLARVLGNLLDNAQRHAAGSVTASVRRSGSTVVLAVADDGPGVPDAERERVFERFVRLDDARSRDDGGAGLGLAIARDVAERHGGTLTAGRAECGGALFELRLPSADDGPTPA
ncbi:HAMP domain-containing sensor histidine kinase [Streptomyces sp. NPDC091212]|uniref:sensor histidine kinase n=1 Tax=Streptomyces sp. NPDC091212 TaxID=3155191 RepID=UPI0034432B2A